MSRKILKSYPHLDELNNYSLKVLDLVIKTYPSWGGFAQVGEFKGEKYLEIKIPAPYQPTERDLMITTWNDDLTISFDWFHAHYGRWFKTPKEAFEKAHIFIERILQEDFIVAIKMVDGSWAGSKGYTPSILHEIKEGEVSYIRSWRGTYNRDYE
jgi:hypothetical protein